MIDRHHPGPLRRPVLVAVLALAACTPEAPPIETPVVVQADTPLVEQVDITLTYPFEIVADRTVSITPVAINGFLTKVAVEVGDEVESGQLIALVDCREYSAQSTQAETTIEKYAARLEETRSQLARLNRMGDSLVAPAEIERAQAEARVAQAELADARAKLSEAQQRKGYCSLRAPFDGFVSERFLDPGAMVSPGGVPVVNLVKTREVRGIASVIEADAPLVLRDAEVEVELNAYPGTRFRATVARFGHSLDRGTRTMRVEMDLPNATASLLPGMTGTAKIVVGSREDAVLVPVTAVLSLEELAYAFVVTEEDGKARAHRVEVELGVDLGDWVEVRSGIAPTDTVVMVGRELIDEGTWVEVRPPGQGLPPRPDIERRSDEQPSVSDTDGADSGDGKDDTGSGAGDARVADTAPDGAKGQYDTAKASAARPKRSKTSKAKPEKPEPKKPEPKKPESKKPEPKKPEPGADARPSEKSGAASASSESGGGGDDAATRATDGAHP